MTQFPRNNCRHPQAPNADSTIASHSQPGSAPLFELCLPAKILFATVPPVTAATFGVLWMVEAFPGECPLLRGISNNAGLQYLCTTLSVVAASSIIVAALDRLHRRLTWRHVVAGKQRFNECLKLAEELAPSFDATDSVTEDGMTITTSVYTDAIRTTLRVEMPCGSTLSGFRSQKATVNAVRTDNSTNQAYACFTRTTASKVMNFVRHRASVRKDISKRP